MAKYSKFQKKPEKKRDINPIWRGVGCLLIVIVPLVSWGLMLLLTPVIVGSGVVPPEIMGTVKFPDWFVKSPITNGFAGFLSSIPDLWLKLILFLVVLLLLTAISSLIYSMVYQVVGPARYSEMDAPEMERKAKAYKR